MSEPNSKISRVNLTTKRDWPEWYNTLQRSAEDRGIWEFVDPDGDESNLSATEPEMPTFSAVLARLQSARSTAEAYNLQQQKAWEDDNAIQQLRKDPQPLLRELPDASEERAEIVSKREKSDYSVIYMRFVHRRNAYVQISDWVKLTTTSAFYNAAHSIMEDNNEPRTLQNLVRQLRKLYRPSDTEYEQSVRDQYNEVLERAKLGNEDPQHWLADWSQAYGNALTLRLYEVQGHQATRAWLTAVKQRLDPVWAQGRLDAFQLAEIKGDEPDTLSVLSSVFLERISRGETRKGKQSSYATLGSGAEALAQNITSKSPQQRNKTPGQNFDCPCKRGPTARKHTWPPKKCNILEYALTGEHSAPDGARVVIPGKAACAAIRGRLNSESKWAKLRKELEELGWISDEPSGSGRREVTCAVIDSSLFNVRKEFNMSVTNHAGLHNLSQSTLIDSCSSCHLVNDEAMLEPGSFKKAPAGAFVEAGTATFPIEGYGTRVMQGALSGVKSAPMDLRLNNVALIQGFHTNIVSEPLLQKAGVWYCGKDCTLRTGELENSVLLQQLERKGNLVFLEYKPLYTSCHASQSISRSTAGTVRSFAAMRRAAADEKPNERVITRIDTGEMWHARAGHLGPEALEKLVRMAKGVSIKGPSHLECEVCAKTLAKRIISRRPTERAARPFYRILWDVFIYPPGYNGMEYMLLLKDDYSSKVWAFPTKTRSHHELFRLIEGFERHVQRRYGVFICCFKHDGESGLISTRGFTEYELWCEEEGIEMEQGPAGTKEPMGGQERAGQWVVDTALKMRVAANLPEALWPEAVQTAARLLNMSPLQSQRWRSPNEVLDSWFTSYFRWYDPAHVRACQTDLRPDWSGIRVFGCRAYVLNQDRAAGMLKKKYKVTPRGHIGYLVGYEATNIYRIWLPKQGRVIITRDVRFNEELFYKSDDEKEQVAERELIEDLELPFSQDLLPEVGFTTYTQALWEQLEESAEPVTHPTRSRGLAPSDLGGAVAFDVPVDEAAGVSLAPELRSEGHGAERTNVNATGLLSPGRTPELEPPSSGAKEREVPDEESATESPSDAPSGVNQGQQASNRIIVPDIQETAPEGSGAVQSGRGQGNQLPGSPAPATEEVVLDEITVAVSEEEIETSIPQNTPGARPQRRRREPQEPDQRRLKSLRPRKQKGGNDQRSLFVLEAAEESLNPYEVLSYEEQVVRIAPGRAVAAFFFTYFPNISEALLSGDKEHRTTHATFTKACTPEKESAEKALVATLSPPPKTWNELATHPRGDLFIAASQREIDNLVRMGAWEVIWRPPNSTPLPLKWVFTDKFDENNAHTLCKARICVRGDKQDVNSIASTYAATLAARSFRIVMALVAKFDLEAKQFDVVNAFLNAVFDEGAPPVYCELPPGYEQAGKCVQLRKALYGLRESPLLWYNDFSSTLRRLGLIGSKEEPCLFYNKERTVFVVFYVDDFLVCYQKSAQDEASQLIEGIKDTYEIKDQGDVAYYLGVRAIRDRQNKRLWLVHDTYLEKVAQRYGLDSCRVPATPLPSGELLKYDGEAPKSRIKAYQERVGSLLYSSVMIRPDIAFACSQLSKFLTNPSEEHVRAADWCIRYAYGTRNVAISYGEQEEGAQALVIASDASYADDPETRRSSNGYVIMLFGGPVAWRAARQDTVTTSTTEAELLALQLTAKETVALERLFRDLELILRTPFSIYCDNQQTIRLVIGEGERVSTKLRHVDIQNLWLRQEYQKGAFDVVYVPTKEMPADGLTKNLPRAKFEHWISLLNLQDSRQSYRLAGKPLSQALLKPHHHPYSASSTS